jgi:transposase InsO family protein
MKKESKHFRKSNVRDLTAICNIRLIKDSELRQSMSRKANCWDNAPQESFYGHMKVDCQHNRLFLHLFTLI